MRGGRACDDRDPQSGLGSVDLSQAALVPAPCHAPAVCLMQTVILLSFPARPHNPVRFPVIEDAAWPAPRP